MRSYRVDYLDTSGYSIKSYICFAFLRSNHTKSWYEEDGHLLIANYLEPETKDYIDLLIETINEIQPCKLITKDGIDYIAYKLTGHYINDLLLLNFIRYLWYSPRDMWNYSNSEFSVIFFKKLEELKDSKLTPLEKLLTANKFASGECKIKVNDNHSNINTVNKLVVKKLPQNFYSESIPHLNSFLINE